MCARKAFISNSRVAIPKNIKIQDCVQGKLAGNIKHLPVIVISYQKKIDCRLGNFIAQQNLKIGNFYPKIYNFSSTNGFLVLFLQPVTCQIPHYSQLCVELHWLAKIISLLSPVSLYYYRLSAKKEESQFCDAIKLQRTTNGGLKQ